MDDVPSYVIEISGSDHPPADPQARDIRRAVELALQRHRCPQARLQIALVDDDAIAKLNQQYLGHKGPTDVLSFDLSEAGVDGVEGQLVVSVETARREAQLRNHAVEAEVLLYCLHGTLHLLGYDDATADGARQMHDLEDQLLGEMGLEAVYGATPT